MTDHEGRFTDVVGTGAAGGYDRIVRSLETVFDGQVACHHIDNVGGYEEGGDFARASLPVGLVVVFDSGDPADPGTDRDPNAAAIVFRHLQTRVLDRLGSRPNSVMDELIHLPDVLFGDVELGIKPIDRSPETCAEWPNVEMGDRLNTALSGKDIGPGGLGLQPHWGDDSDPGDYNPSASHAVLLRSGLQRARGGAPNAA